MDLSLSPGRRVAVVGPSGAGKSTLAAVLLGFLPYDAGLGHPGGRPDSSSSRGDDLRTVVGLVGQDAYLFDTTVGENLSSRAAATRPTTELLGVLAGWGWPPGWAICPRVWPPRWAPMGRASRVASASGWR